MTITYPLTFPAVSVIKSSFRLFRTSSENESPITLAQQSYKFPGERWEGEVTFKPVRMLNAGLIKAFLGELYGIYGTFLYGDPDFLANGPQGSAGGVPVVNGGSQTGNNLNIRGLPLSTNNVYRRGDYFQLGSGASSRLYMFTQDVNSDGAGHATIQFVPAIRLVPNDGDGMTIAGAKGVFKSAENVAQWDSDYVSVHGFTLAFKEAVVD